MIRGWGFRGVRDGFNLGFRVSVGIQGLGF